MPCILIHIVLTLAGDDYKITTPTLKFEPSNETISQQCLEIEIINDSLPEGWEVFTLLFSTNNPTVDLTTRRFDVSIRSNDGRYQQRARNDSDIILMYFCVPKPLPVEHVL